MAWTAGLEDMCAAGATAATTRRLAHRARDTFFAPPGSVRRTPGLSCEGRGFGPARTSSAPTPCSPASPLPDGYRSCPAKPRPAPPRTPPPRVRSRGAGGAAEDAHVLPATHESMPLEVRRGKVARRLPPHVLPRRRRATQAQSTPVLGPKRVRLLLAIKELSHVARPTSPGQGWPAQVRVVPTLVMLPPLQLPGEHCGSAAKRDSMKKGKSRNILQV